MFASQSICLAVATVLGFGSFVGCDAKPPAPTKKSTEPPPPLPDLVGVPADKFQCSSLISAEKLGELVGGTATFSDVLMPAPENVAAPCSYLIDSGTSQGMWQFDFDCRPGAKQRADVLFKQYAETSAANVAAYDPVAAAAEAKLLDARPGNAPSPAVEVAVGARALDHHGQGLIFLDDDTPCYGRVIGASPDGRLALAQFLSKVLIPATAPMTPRAAE